VIDTTNQKDEDEDTTPFEILVMRGKYPEIVINSNTKEDNWKCDICLSLDNDEDDPLCICDMCLVVVHPSCYRRDLYEQDLEDEDPWHCARCNYILSVSQLQKNIKLPACMLCNDLSGAMIDL
jgi:hypothetical protein